ncbi:hypothetical protein JZ751_002832 [Albula glossodonta]|uniref:Uncharacterized protein n=1 Tax=Albula glossodonta TaxID=121402 RepID=A0A8T2N801_9TELE|nr:hypothetical protein JZ751_002832 [Albula glossodonta]
MENIQEWSLLQVNSSQQGSDFLKDPCGRQEWWTQVRRGSASSSAQQTGTSRTVKRYPSSSWPITSNALPNGNGNGHQSNQRLSLNGQGSENLSNAVAPIGQCELNRFPPLHNFPPLIHLTLMIRDLEASPIVIWILSTPASQTCDTSSPCSGRLQPAMMQLHTSLSLLLLTPLLFRLLGANLTSNLDRIKIVFTPMVCKRTCSGGRCFNSCEKGDTTTIYSENQSQPPKSQGFRLSAQRGGCANHTSGFGVLPRSQHFACCLLVVYTSLEWPD